MSRMQIDFPESSLFTHTLEVRVDDLNYGGHLGHDRLVSLMHEARVRFFRSFGAEEWRTDRAALMVVELAVSYAGEAFLGDRLRIEIAPGEIASRRADLLYRISRDDDGSPVALGRTRVVFVDPETKKSVRLPESFRAAISRPRPPSGSNPRS